MFFKKHNDKEAIKPEDDSEKITILEPRICLFDLQDAESQKIITKGYNVSLATLGRAISLPRKQQGYVTFCLPNLDYPRNIHEYDILVFDLAEKKAIPYNEEEHFHQSEKKQVTNYILTKYPQTVFEPRPIGGNIIRPDINRFMSKKSVIVVFASRNEKIDYTLAAVESQGYHVTDTSEHDLYSFANIRYDRNLCGREIRIIAEHPCLKNILEDSISSFFYEVIFYHPTDWNGKKIESLFPIMENKQGEIISYFEAMDDSIICVFPQLSNKGAFLTSLLEKFFPEILPELFPYSTMFAWRNEEEYFLPNHQKLLDMKKQVEEEYQTRITEIGNDILDNTKEYSYLHELIIETGDKLVDAVKNYFDWLGFENVRKMDRYEELKEEDLQVELDNGLLVIEVKGLGGTSKDSDCSQINKIKYRRAKERNKFDVFGLYIVNHQRYLPPKNRQNPPFTDKQIGDAINEERGLLTTWEMFKSYNYILEGIITKEDIRGKMLDYGIIRLTPRDIIQIGIVTEVLKKGYVAILNLDDNEIIVGETVFILRDGLYKSAKIVQIMFNDVKVSQISNGEVGIEFDTPLKNKSQIFKKI